MILFRTPTIERGRLKRGIKTRLYSERVTVSGPGVEAAGKLAEGDVTTSVISLRWEKFMGFVTDINLLISWSVVSVYCAAVGDLRVRLPSK